MNRKQLTALFAATLIVVAYISAAAPKTQAQTLINVTFNATGYTRYDGQFYVIDGTSYGYWNPAPTFQWAPGSPHTVAAVTPITNWDSVKYKFGNWGNGDGNGLTASSGTFITPNADITVTLNYIKSTYTAYFAIGGTSNVDTNILKIDGTTYQLSALPTMPFYWESGSTHTVEALGPVSSWDTPPQSYSFGSWTNGNGLITSSGTFTMPAQDVTVTANYVSGSAVQMHTAYFAIGGTSNVDTGIIKIDGTTYQLSALPTTPFSWESGSTHNVEALGPVYSWDTPSRGFKFDSWTNGNGLTTSSGTFTMPNQDVTVTANYVRSTVQVLFRQAGLTNPSSWTVLTIDGVNYNYWQVEQTDFQMTIGSEHTVTAATPLTGYDAVARYFNGWTNGNGLTDTSTTFIVPATDVTVTANYGLTAPTKQATSLTINCNVMDENRLTTIHGALTSSGSGVSGKTVVLSYFNGSSWLTIGSSTTTTGGAYTYDWTVPLIANGVYPVKAEFSEDSSYLASSAITGSSGNGPSLNVLPESWGSIVALAACFVGALVFFKLKARRSSAK